MLNYSYEILFATIFLSTPCSRVKDTSQLSSSSIYPYRNTHHLMRASSFQPERVQNQHQKVFRYESNLFYFPSKIWMSIRYACHNLFPVWTANAWIIDEYIANFWTATYMTGVKMLFSRELEYINTSFGFSIKINFLKKIQTWKSKFND